MSVDTTEYSPRHLEVNEALLDLGFQAIGFGSATSTAVPDEPPSPGLAAALGYQAASEPPTILNHCQLVGEYDLLLPAPIEQLSLVFTPAFFRLDWSNCGKLADMMAAMFAPLCLSQTGPEGTATLDEIGGAISFVANELIENALKFHVDPTFPVKLTASLYPTRLVLLVANKVSQQAGSKFKELLEIIAAGDPTELLLEKMEENALDPEGEGSGLGILTILSDYRARAGWKFETLAGRSNEQTVYSMVQLPLHEEASYEGNSI